MEEILCVKLNQRKNKRKNIRKMESDKNLKNERKNAYT